MKRVHTIVVLMVGAALISALPSLAIGQVKDKSPTATGKKKPSPPVLVVIGTPAPKMTKAQKIALAMSVGPTVPLIAQNRPLGLINIATEQWEFLTSADLQFLSAAGSQVAVALERARLYDTAETQRIRLEQELEMARAVQKSLLPTQPPTIPGFTLVADWRSAREVAGDFYDFFLLPDGRWALVLADVSGKGAPSALYMAMTRSLIRSEASHHTNPSAVLTEVNRRLLVESPSEMFVTVLLCGSRSCPAIAYLCKRRPSSALSTTRFRRGGTPRLWRAHYGAI